MLTQSILSGSILDEEIALEEEAIEQGIIRYRELVKVAIERGDGASLKPAERLVVYWLKDFSQVIAIEQQEIRDCISGKERELYGPPLIAVDADRLAVITMHEILSACMASPSGVKISHITYCIGRSVLAEAHRDKLKLDYPGEVTALRRRFRRPSIREYNWKAGKVLDDKLWDKPISVKVGMALMWMLIQVASINGPGEPFRLAFHHERRLSNKKRTAYIRIDDDALDIIEQGHEARQFMRPRYMPMIVRPLKWVEDVQGGYVRIRTPFISKPTGTQRDALQQADLSQVFRCIDDIAGTPWRVNPMVHQVVKEVWQSGGMPMGDPLNIPPASNIELPPRPHDIDTNDDARKVWKRDARLVHESNVGVRAARCDFLNKLHVADRMATQDRFYFPHQLDFRGRCYPVPPHLQHQSNDICRGLLMCADGKPIDVQGLWWLKVHAANCYGHDKLPFQMRHDWTEENMDLIQRTVADPMGQEWWRQADKPWQFLAACYAVVFPDECGAYIPVQIDGTCNGLQHYAALGRSEDLAALVNMTAADWPRDLYSEVTGVVQRRVEDDAAAGHELAQLVAQFVSRKVCKPPVMTYNYGVTMVGARKQVSIQLERFDINKHVRYDASVYLANCILGAVGELCAGAATIMDWLRACATSIAGKKSGEAVRWTTPLGLPVVQPYRKYYTRAISTIEQDVTLLIEDESVPVSPKKHSNGAAPNFIHSIDATHMLMTARKCATEGVWFAGVHDCYWTHAATIDELAGILRREFVDLHRAPLLDNLASEWREKFPNAEIPDPPARGNYDIGQVEEAPYFFN